ncbi:MAG: hypothetical protein JXR70_12295 [Spirochaetales bacterium]|nr:hypothetical protein [Spirochaetales bacterium]
MKKTKSTILLMMILFIGFMTFNSCSGLNEPVIDEAAVEAELNQELAVIMNIYQKALLTDDPDSVDELKNALENFDAKYDSNLADDFKASVQSSKLTDPIKNLPLIENLPINKDGDVYLSGGVNSLVNYLIDWVGPNVTEGNYNHGAILDLNKFDPTNLDGPCFHTAVLKGAGFETPMNWKKKQNVSVFTSKTALNAAALNSAQSAMDYYCNPNNTNQSYGFFKNKVDFFSLVTKEDNYWWYCTKVIWRIYNDLGINIDSDTSAIDWTKSGLYSVVKAYYKVRYFWSSSKAKKALNDYIDKARKTIVLAEEIYFSNQLSKKFEIIR